MVERKHENPIEPLNEEILSHKRILVLHSELGDLIGRILDKNKILADITKSHKEAFEWAEKNNYSLAIVHDRIYFTESKTLPALQRELTKKNPYTKMIVVSPSMDNVYGLIQEGLFEYPIPKVIPTPFENEDLVDNIRKILSTKQTHKLIDEFIAKIDPKGNLRDDEREFLIKEIEKRTDLTKESLETVVRSDEGYTSRSGFEFGDRFIKIDVLPRLEHEAKVYRLDLGEFNDYRPQLLEFVKTDDIAIMALTNLRNEIIPARSSSIFLMGLLHKEASRYIDQFRQLIYYGVHKIPHWEEGQIPYANLSGDGLKRFEQTEIDVKKVKPIVEDYLARQKIEAQTIIHGDWKPENMVNGHLVDYAMAGISFEVDELAYYLSDSRFQINLQKFHQIVDDYIQTRSQHDLDFKLRAESGYRKNMHQLADSAFLSQLVLRHSVMNKRDLSDDSKFEQRQYYQNAINNILKEGRFV